MSKENRKSSATTARTCSFSDIPKQVGVQDDAVQKLSSEYTVANAIQTFMLMEAKANAEAAELRKRLVMQQFRPCKLYPVLIYFDGLRWVCEYASMKSQLRDYDGIDVIAYGPTPEDAMQNFDMQWTGITDDNTDTEDGDTEDDEDI